VVYRAGHETDSRSRWIADKQRRLGTTKACVALANKNARIVWSLIAHQEVSFTKTPSARNPLIIQVVTSTLQPMIETLR